MTLPREDIETVRERILEAAGERFEQFGFGKTTMAEIAGDCGMSAANLYRYFESKHDIGAAMASRCLNDKTERLAAIVQDDVLTPSEKIESLILKDLHYTYEEWAGRPRVNELVDAVCQQRADLVNDYVETMQSMWQAIVQQGIDSGEFAPCDPAEAAEALKAATFMFDYPGAMTLCSLDVFERKAQLLSKLVLEGLRQR